jgi:hypothetical protein
MIFEIALPGQGIIRGNWPAKTHRKEAKARGIRIRSRATTLNLASCFALFLGLAVVTQGQAEDYYVYQAPNGELVISNKEPPPGSKIIKQLPGVPDREVPQAQEPGKPQPNVQAEGPPKLFKSE